MDEEQSTGHKIGNYIGNFIFAIVVIVAIALVFATIGAMAAVTAESYQWFREALNWV
jgi:hypothetical protein